MKPHLLLGHKAFLPLTMASWLALCPSTLQYPLVPCLYPWRAPSSSSPHQAGPTSHLPPDRSPSSWVACYYPAQTLPWFRCCHSLCLQAALASRKPHAVFQSPHSPLRSKRPYSFKGPSSSSPALACSATPPASLPMALLPLPQQTALPALSTPHMPCPTHLLFRLHLITSDEFEGQFKWNVLPKVSARTDCC